MAKILSLTYITRVVGASAEVANSFSEHVAKECEVVPTSSAIEYNSDNIVEQYIRL